MSAPLVSAHSLEPHKRAVCKEQLVSRPVFRQALLWQLEGKGSAGHCSPPPIKKCVSCCYFFSHVSFLKLDPPPLPGREKGPIL